MHFGHYFHLPWKQEFTKIWAGRMYPLKTSKHPRFSDSFSGYRKRSIACSGLCKTPFTRLIDFCWFLAINICYLFCYLHAFSLHQELCLYVTEFSSWRLEIRKGRRKKKRRQENVITAVNPRLRNQELLSIFLFQGIVMVNLKVYKLLFRSWDNILNFWLSKFT